ncbi:MAG TPA: hypothetical protein PLQ76_00240 [bacterium]|nr:hypothetical protein [bacterium]
MKRIITGIVSIAICLMIPIAAHSVDKKNTASGEAKPSVKQEGKSTSKKDLAIVLDIGKTAEDIFNNVNAGKWKAVPGKIKHLRTAALNSDLARIIGGDDAKKVNTALDAIEKAAADKDKKSALEAANQLTFLAINIAGRYNPAIPVGISLLEYFGRELQLGAAAKDTARINAAIKNIRNTWDMVKGPVREHGGVVEEKAFSLLVLGLEKAGSSSAIVSLYPRVIEQVGRLEKVFEKKR